MGTGKGCWVEIKKKKTSIFFPFRPFLCKIDFCARFALLFVVGLVVVFGFRSFVAVLASWSLRCAFFYPLAVFFVFLFSLYKIKLLRFTF